MFGTPTSILTLILPSGTSTAQTTYQISSGTLIATTNGNTVALTSNNVVVDNFTVHSVVSGGDQLLRIRITLRTNGKVQTSSTFGNTIMLP
jgi:hypothetical protein